MSEKKIGAYICSGCGIGDRLDTKQLATIAEREGKAAFAKQHEFLCSAEGVKLIQDDIDAGEVTHLMLGACSRRVKTEAFNFDGVAMVRANLREGVIWVRPDDPEAAETTQDMANDYIRMACAEAKFTKVPEANTKVGGNKRILVVGGGATGLTAAIEAANAGYEVAIVEKTGSLGGKAARLWRDIPQRAPYDGPADSGIAELIAAVAAHAKIAIFLNSTLTRTNGAPGCFEAQITTESGGSQTELFGAIVMASGYEPYDANQLPELGFGASANVIDQLALEDLARAADGAPIARPSDGKPVKSVVFVQCAGQRSDKEGHLPYCSGHCCSTSIKQAMYFKDANPEIDTTILYTDLRTPGSGGEDFYRAGQDRGITFSKGVVSAVQPEDDGLAVEFQDLILNEPGRIDADLVVLATGQVPNSGVDIEAQIQAAALADNAEEAEVPEVEIKPADSILNLTYRQGPDLPQLKHGFSDSHFICFPYESRRTGIYPAGPVRRPMDLAQAREDGTGAALKAIQAVENAALGRAAHPRSGDLSFPSFRKEGCTQCKRCTVECPFGAIDEDEKRYPVFNEARCRRCGTCMGACPVRVISFENYSVETVGQQLKAVEIPDEFEEKPRVLILACENDAYPALDMAGVTRQSYSQYVRVIPVRCLGSVNTIWVTDALNSGYDGVLLMGCKKGDNYQCHFVKGSELASYRMGKIDDTLQTLNLEKERVMTHEVSITDIQRIPEIINDYMGVIDKIGLSPFKF
ncbi:MAG: FAD-dependent oxidoreductase [Proteobacteria bacterium]|nr:MAG: FAD-dependent oxidoreductase [Pseudomonadota bacterium]